MCAMLVLSDDYQEVAGLQIQERKEEPSLRSVAALDAF